MKGLRTIPNMLTIGRFFIAIVYFVALSVFGIRTRMVDLEAYSPVYWMALLALFGAAALTDVLDGYLARRLGQTSDFGRVADPLMDKIIVCGSFIYLTAVDIPDWRGRLEPIVPVYAAVIVVVRELVVTALRGFVESRGMKFGATIWGKAKMLCQSITIACLLAFLAFFAAEVCAPGSTPARAALVFIYVAVWVTVAVTAVSGIVYLVQAARLLESRDG